MTGALLLAVTVAFPKQGMVLPPVECSYMNGFVSRGVTNLVVQGKAVDIYKTGGWVTMVDLAEGTNYIEIVAGGATTNIPIVVAFKPKPKLGKDGKPIAELEKKYEKLPYASDSPVPHPHGKSPKDIFVVIDPGHGGANDTGAVSPHGYFEKDANLLLAKDVRDALVEKGYNVEMTRETDVPLVLTERPRTACEKNADAFISIHHNAPPFNKDPRKVRYTAVYEWNELGKSLAKEINAAMGKALEGDIPNNGVMHANFAVTRNPEIPSCLIETDFISTPEGELSIWTPSRRKKNCVCNSKWI